LNHSKIRYGSVTDRGIRCQSSLDGHAHNVCYLLKVINDEITLINIPNTLLHVNADLSPI